MRVLAAAAIVFTAVLMTSCHETEVKQGLRSYYMDRDCTLRVSTGKADKVSLVSVYRGEVIVWCNRTDHTVTFLVSDPKVFAGRRSIRLAPGECARIRVGTGDADWTISWRCWTVSETGEIIDEGGGGSPGKSEEPPPPPSNP